MKRWIKSATEPNLQNSQERVTSEFTFDFIYQEDYDSDEIESALYSIFEEDLNLEISGIDFHSVDYEDVREFDGNDISQCSVDFLHEGNYEESEICDRVFEELKLLGYEVIGYDFAAMAQGGLMKRITTSDDYNDNDQSIKVNISELLNGIQDQAAATAFRHILFSPSNTIDWNEAEDILEKWCPEFRRTSETQ